MNYQQAMDYIEKCADYGIVPGLDNIRELLNRLGNPQEGLRCIHIAGTNGKGSVLAFLCSVLKYAGYRTGAYVSPTIFTYTERFQIQGKPVSKKQVARLMELVARTADGMEKEGLAHPTPFEIETAMSFLLFQEKNCDIVVLETGMGGSMDATNIIRNPLVCVITPISMDHMVFLGDTLEKIAGQKAGIMKADTMVVSAPQCKAVEEVLKAEAVTRSVKELRFVAKETIQAKSRGLKGQRLSYVSYKNVDISMLGRYQIENAALVLETVDVLNKSGYPVKEKALRKGMAEAVWPGRFQVIMQKPLFVVDGAHNEAGAIELGKSLEFYFTNRRIIYIMGMFRDKECERVISHTCSLAEHIITVAVKENPRAMPALELAKLVLKQHPRVTVADSIEEAVELACLLADKDTVIVAFGSLAYLGDCIRTVEKRKYGQKKKQGKMRREMRKNINDQ